MRSADPQPSESPSQRDIPLVMTDRARPAPPEPFQWPEALALTVTLVLASLLFTGWVRPLDLWPW